jgi:hypothetical protein
MRTSGFGKLAKLGFVVALSLLFCAPLFAQNDGTVWAWGDNTYGQLGNRTNTSTTDCLREAALRCLGFCDDGCRCLLPEPQGNLGKTRALYNVADVVPNICY